MGLGNKMHHCGVINSHYDIAVLVQEKRNFIANALELHPSGTHWHVPA